MKNRYDILFITPIPSFYKVNLFNEIADKKRILVLYTGANEEKRSNDFYKNEAKYEFQSLGQNTVGAILQLVKLLCSHSFNKVIVSGWDTIISFVAVFFHRKKGNGCMVESSIFDSSTDGWKAWIKIAFLKRVSTVYASGKSQLKLVEVLGFKGQSIEFGGCGILRYQEQPPYEERQTVQNFLYVGRLIEEKNLSLLISVFNDLPQLKLTIIGEGPLMNELKQLAKGNTHFMGSKNNSELSRYYMGTDVFVLPSNSETWGLVVEEALNNGTPVIVSSHVGCSESIVVPYSSGIVFENGSKEGLLNAVKQMCEVDSYNHFRKNVSKMDFMERSKQQVMAFL